MSEIVELHEDLSSSPLYNEDMAPVPRHKRSWSFWNLTTLWISMAICIPTYLLASSMMASGLHWHETLIIIGLANLIITIPMALNGHAGVKYGIPFPVAGRASFGHKGVHIASLIRALFACGWFGVQTWIGGMALYELWCAISGSASAEGLNAMKFVCFGLFWAINMLFIWKGPESSRSLGKLAAPVLLIACVALIAWAVRSGSGFGAVLEQSVQLEQPATHLTHGAGTNTLILSINPLRNTAGEVKAEEFQISVIQKADGKTFSKDSVIGRSPWLALYGREQVLPHLNWGVSKLDTTAIMAPNATQVVGVQLRSSEANGRAQSSIIETAYTEPEAPSSRLWLSLIWLTAMVGFWGTMSISIADITRYTKSQKAQAAAQFIGLPGTMMLFSFVAILVTCASLIVFDGAFSTADVPWDPAKLFSKFDSTWMVILGQLFLILATLSTNIAANVIAPANAFSNLAPKKISYRTGGILTAVIGLLLCPWAMLDELSTILIAVSGVLGPILAVMLCDYFLIRKKDLNLASLFKTDGEYSYKGGFNVAAIVALLAGIVVAMIGMWVEPLAFLHKLSWFSGFLITFVLYFVLMSTTDQSTTEEATEEMDAAA